GCLPWQGCGSAAAARPPRFRASARRPVANRRRSASADDAEDVLFLEDHVVLAAELHLGAGPLAVDHLVADLHARLQQTAILQPLALANRHDLALHGLFLGGVGNNEASLGAGFGSQWLEQQTVVQGLEFHDVSFLEWALIGSRRGECQRASRRSNWADAAASSATVSHAISPSSRRLRTSPWRYSQAIVAPSLSGTDTSR